MKGGDKMESKQIWITVLVALIVAIIASLITVYASKEVLLGPDGTTLNTTQKEINANRCQADNMCETNALSVKDNSLFNADVYLLRLAGNYTYANYSFACLDEHGKITRSGVNCMARNMYYCRQFDEKTASTIISYATGQSGYGEGNIAFKERENLTVRHNVAYGKPYTTILGHFIEIDDINYEYQGMYSVTTHNVVTGDNYRFYLPVSGRIVNMYGGAFNVSIGFVPYYNYNETYIVLDDLQTPRNVDFSYCF